MSDLPLDPSFQRRSYERGSLSRDQLAADPVEQFRQWFTDATSTPEVIEPNAMTLSTVDEEGQPSSRTVLLKAYDERGFVFFTNYESRKAADIAGNPKVALLFPWLALERQLKIQGVAEKISRTETVKYFLSRPIGHRLGAWVSNQSRVVSSRSLLLAKLDEMKRKFADGEVPCPDFWGGYRVVPSRFEFWQGGKDRIHDSFAYRRDGDEWKIERLAP
ncbi:MAG: pyridoxamine 5'-phosphate oxidase [Verrucomicrobiae bacterium]|nr:pyridoxamine 5'-phosphate oxidase [Verrucomicrobiae bacterium]